MLCAYEWRTSKIEVLFLYAVSSIRNQNLLVEEICSFASVIGFERIGVLPVPAYLQIGQNHSVVGIKSS